jgi:hypothetical protein
MPTFDRPRSKPFIEGYLQAADVVRAIDKNTEKQPELLRSIAELFKVHAQVAKILRERGLEPADETSGALYLYEEARDLLIELGPKGQLFRFSDWLEMRKSIAEYRLSAPE